MLFRWRDQFGLGQEKPITLAPAQVVEGGTKKPGAREASLLAELLPCPDEMKEVELADGRCVFAPADANPDAVRREFVRECVRIRSSVRRRRTGFGARSRAREDQDRPIAHLQHFRGELEVDGYAGF